ncbi:hypothetical protein FXW35_04650 [Candidatus Liberibacter asiaticus]|nr:hypothetical protein FXW35_04650 [Candidatus Liberibacter asiaticus]KAE9516171.1 hypothetical protein FXW27_04425 [Candidatus Liberibacter asiaticus]
MNNAVNIKMNVRTITQTNASILKNVLLLSIFSQKNFLQVIFLTSQEGGDVSSCLGDSVDLRISFSIEESDIGLILFSLHNTLMFGIY